MKKTDFFKSKLTSCVKTVVLETTDSTNNVCKKLSKETNEDVLVVAFSQTNGKGRLGRSFFSPQETGIYLSLLLHPKFAPQHCHKITTAAAVAVNKAIKEISNTNPLIKWVNDIYIDHKKVCGILSEAALVNESSCVDYAILGIGINLSNPLDDFPKDIKNKAGSIFGDTHCSDDTKAKLINLIVNNFYNIYRTLPSANYMEEYRLYSLLKGKTVSFFKGEKQTKGLVLQINDEAALILKTDEGEITLNAGEVSLEF